MIITRLKLTNFMSHINKEFFFTPGANAILGPNGSGKSTILYAIGVALFNHNQRNLKDLVSYGHSSATIELDFINNQAISYRIERSFGSSSAARLVRQGIDLVADSYKEIYDFIEHQLETSPSSLFVDTLYLHSSALTAPWLLPDNDRKRLFDRLLAIEAYQNAWSKLREPVSVLNEEIAKYKNHLLNIQKLTIKRDDEKAYIKVLQQKIHKAEELLAVESKAYFSNKRLLELKKLSGELSGLQMKEVSLNKELVKVGNVILDAYDKKCPTCGQSIDYELGYDLIQKEEEKRQQLLNKLIANLRGQIEIKHELDTSNVDLDRLQKPIQNPDTQRSELQSTIDYNRGQIKAYLAHIEELEKDLTQEPIIINTLTKLENKLKTLNNIRDGLRKVAPMLSESLVSVISKESSSIASNLMSENVSVLWGQDYSVRLNKGGRTLHFNQLSEGERIMVALSIKMSLAKLSSSDIIFLDEPTINLDSTARMMLAENIGTSPFNQLFIISHDNTFESMADNVINLGV